MKMNSVNSVAEKPKLRALPGWRPEASPPSDEAIVEGIVGGEEWAADALYDRVHTVVERTLRRLLREQSPDLEDLMQTSFERIILTLSGRRFAGACSLPTWAASIASHVAIDALRARVRDRKLFRRESPSAPELADIAPSTPPERRLEARSEVERLQGILIRMKPDQARTLVLHDVLGHDLSEIAVLTGVSVAAAQSRLVRGRKELLRRAGAIGSFSMGRNP
jgi:RNA polymerase sigma-70 factor (ECF subfamily)